MTFLEKLKEDQPTSNIPDDAIGIGCPKEYGYENALYEKCGIESCAHCWNREMPNTNKSVLLTMNKETELNIDKKIKEQEEKSYNQGLTDAWELVRTLYDKKCAEIEKIFDVDGGFWTVIRDYTPQDALAKLKAYEEAQSKIDIGDVVVDLNEIKGIVIGILHDEDKVDVWYEDNSRPQIVSTRFLTKTGEHVNLRKILEQIGE